MGDKGYSYSDILQHYFPGANLCAVPWRDQGEGTTRTAQESTQYGPKQAEN